MDATAPASPAQQQQQQQQQQRWKTSDAKANKAGPHRTVYWVRSKPEKAAGEPGYGAKNRIGGKEYELSSTYQGSWLDNQKHGFGTQVYRNGNQYEGEWHRGRRHGHGTLYVRRGGRLEKVYAGGWKNNKKDGLGVQLYPDGSRYEGEWEAGARNGTGSAWLANGDVYVGEWKDDKRCGTGTMTYADGNIYEGSWLNDLREGAGILYFSKAEKVLDAEWAADIARCSVYMDAGSFFGTADAPQGPRADASGEELLRRFREGRRRMKEPLPELGLDKVDQLLAARVREIQAERAAVRELAERPLTDLFDSDELELLHQVFLSSTGAEGAGAPVSELETLLVDAGFPVSADADLARMLVDLDLGDKVADMRLGFGDFVRAVHMARGAAAAEANADNDADTDADANAAAPAGEPTSGESSTQADL